MAAPTTGSSDNNNDAIMLIQKQIFALTQALGNITQQVSNMSSQKTMKQGPPNEILEEKAVQPEKKSEKSEEDYFVPTFGS